jgi:hypothetical protein
LSRCRSGIADRLDDAAKGRFVVYGFAVLAALIVAVGEVVQQRMAAQAPPQDNLSPKLLLWLVQQPRWLAGIACTFVGDGAFSVAVGQGSVVVVEAVFVIRLLFALTLSALWGSHRVPVKELLGGLAMVIGLAVFLLALRPTGRAIVVPDVRWSYGAGVPVAVAAGLAVAARRRTQAPRALLLGLGAGIVFGVQASLIQAAVHAMTKGGVLSLLAGWKAYAVVAVALFGMLLVQSAFESAPLSDSYPGVVTAQLLCAIGIGLFVLHGRINLGTVNLVFGLLALVALILGMVIVTRSTVLSHSPEHPGLPPDLEQKVE